MKKNHLQMVVIFLLASGFAACAGDRSVPSTVGRLNALASPVPSSAAGATSGVTNVMTAAAGASNETRATVMAIDAGSTIAVGNWLIDQDYAEFGSGSTNTITKTVDTRHVTNPAPQAVYQTQRWATTLAYTLPGLTPSAAYTVRLHFAESYFASSRKRVFNVKLNGIEVLSNFDIFRAAGGANIAIVKAFRANADAGGRISIVFGATVNRATIAGIEVVAETVTPTPVPTTTPVSTYTPTASAAPKLALNPNPFTVKICSSDPCSPTIDSKSNIYNTNWFGGTATLPTENLMLPCGASCTNIGYEEIPIYTATNADPTYSWYCASAWGKTCSPRPLVIHLPSGVHADASGTDYLFDVINTDTGAETTAYEFNIGSDSAANGTETPVNSGSPNPLWVAGWAQAGASCFAGGVNNCWAGSSANTSEAADELDPVELLQQLIPHKLHLVADCVESSGYIFPAGSNGGASWTSGGCPPQGEMLWLDKTDAQIDAMSIPRWVKTLYHNLHDYGWTVLDNGPGATGARNQNHLNAVSDFTWSVTGRPSQWTLMFNEMSAEGTTLTANGGYYPIQIPTASGVTVSNFHWVQYNQNI